MPGMASWTATLETDGTTRNWVSCGQYNKENGEGIVDHISHYGGYPNWGSNVNFVTGQGDLVSWAGHVILYYQP